VGQAPPSFGQKEILIIPNGQWCYGPSLVDAEREPAAAGAGGTFAAILTIAELFAAVQTLNNRVGAWL
jgi:hypothetical protein